MIRAKPLKFLRGYREHFGAAEDRDLWWRLSQLGEIHCISERLYRYRKHSESVTQKSELETAVAVALIADLSAIARHCRVDDSELLEDFRATREPRATIQKYVQLIGDRYPADRLANYRAVTRGCGALTGHQEKAGAVRYSFGQLIRNPLSWKRYRLISAAFLKG